MSCFRYCRYLALLVFIAGASPVHAQAPSTFRDSLFRRAKRLVAEGNGVAGRALVDSLLRGTQEGTASYGDVLYWRGALAETAADAERDYRRVIVEYPLSGYADHALLAMADLESARGDRAAALQHLQRFVKEHSASLARGAAALNAARLAFELRDTRVGCSMVSAARASTPSTNVETLNQIEYLSTRCSAAELAGTTPAPAPVNAPMVATNTPAPITRPPRDTTPKPPVRNAPDATKPAPIASMVNTVRDTTPPNAPRNAAEITKPIPVTPVPSAPAPATRRGSFTIQLAAYNTRVDAEHLVAKLKSKGVNARVSGEAKPFRVRLDFYPTRQAAQDEVNALRSRGVVGFVTTETPPPLATP